MQKKYWIAAIIVILIATIIKITTTEPATNFTSPNKIKVAATFYPLAYIAEQIGGDYIEVENITPPGTEPHDFEPTPKNIAAIYQANLFILNGQGVDAWAEKILSELTAKNTTVIRMSDHIEKITLAETDHEHEHDTHEEAPEYDPHFWLDPNNMATEADVIADKLIAIDSTHAKEYNHNRDVFKQKLAALHAAYQTGLATCASREIVTTHNAFGYLAKRYNLITFYILGLSPEEEPSPKRIAEVSQLAKDKQIHHIFFEGSVSQKLSETIAQEVGAQTLVLSPVESLSKEQASTNQDYISIMNQNLRNLKTALVCP